MTRRKASRRTRPTVTKLNATPAPPGRRANTRDRRAGTPTAASAEMAAMRGLRDEVDQLKQQTGELMQAVAAITIHDAAIDRAAYGVLKAWDWLPGGQRPDLAEIENWLVHQMSPAIAQLRKALE